MQEHSAIDFVPIAKADEQYHAMLEPSAMAAPVKPNSLRSSRFGPLSHQAQRQSSTRLHSLTG
jgi:hypothetical protein